MKHLFAPIEIAALAKELGFKRDCLGYFDSENNLRLGITYSYRSQHAKYLAPIYQQIIDWLIKEHSLSVEGAVWVNTTTWMVRDHKTGVTIFNCNHDDYYDALNEVLIKTFQELDKKVKK